MTEKKIEAGDLQKALQTLQDLAKGHGDRGTATTEVPGMVGESGATQVYHTPNNSDPKGGWAGSSWEDQDWSDSIGPDGTDYKSAGVAMRKSVAMKIAKGQDLTKGEENFVKKGGMSLFAKKAMDKHEEDAKKGMYGSKDKDAAMKAMSKDEDHEDEAEDKEMLREMVKPSAMKKKDMSKSFSDHAAENPAVKGGFEVSEFLAGFAQVMHKSLLSMESRITDRVLTGLAMTSADQGEVSKSMAEALANLGEVLAAQAQRIEQVEAGAARAPKSTLSKSVSTGEADSESLTKSQVTGILVDLVQKGQATAQDVLKYDATGEISPDLRNKVVGRR